MKPSFNLLTQPWIASLAPGSEVKEHSLADALLNAHQLSEIIDESPLVVAALHRLLIAILHRVLGPANVEAWGRLWRAGEFPRKPLETYFQQWSHRFDLFDTTFPFYQSAAIEEGDGLRPVGTLEFQIASANNATLFDHTTDDGGLSLTPARAARALVTHQCFALAGLVGYLKRSETDGDKGAIDAPAARGAVCLLKGSSLFQTLLLNLCEYSATGDSDQPAWERKNGQTKAERLPDGRVDLCTWQSRRARLFASKNELIDHVKLVAGFSVPYDWSPFGPESLQAFVLKPEAKATERPWYAFRISSGRQVWRDSQTLLFTLPGKNFRPKAIEWTALLVEEGELPEDFSYSIEVLGAATDQQKIELWAHERLTVSAGLLHDDHCREMLTISLDAAENTAKVLAFAVMRLAEETLSPKLADKPATKPDRKRCRGLATSFGVEPKFWAALHVPFLHFLRDLGAFTITDVEQRRLAREQAVSDWKEKVRQSALAAFDSTAVSLGTNSRLTRAHAIASLALRRSLPRPPRAAGKEKHK